MVYSPCGHRVGHDLPTEQQIELKRFKAFFTITVQIINQTLVKCPSSPSFPLHPHYQSVQVSDINCLDHCSILPIKFPSIISHTAPGGLFLTPLTEDSLVQNSLVTLFFVKLWENTYNIKFTILSTFKCMVVLVVKNRLPMQENVRDLGLIPGSGGSPGGRNGNPLQYSVLEGYSPRSHKELDMTEATEHSTAETYSSVALRIVLHFLPL